MEPYDKEVASKAQAPESSQSRINHVVATNLAMRGDHDANNEPIASCGSFLSSMETTASYSRIGSNTGDFFGPSSSPMEADDLFGSFSDPYSFSSLFNPWFFEAPSSSVISFRPASPAPKSKWTIVKNVIRAAQRLRRVRSINNLPDWELKSIISAAGESSSGAVYGVVNRPTGQTHALIELPYDASRREEIRRQVDMLKELDHPNLVKCYDAIISTDNALIYLVLEPLEGSVAGVTISTQSELVSLAHPLVLGLAYLHQNKIPHGDIKHSTVFFTHTRQIKLLYLGKTLSNAPPFLAEIGALHDEFSWDVWSVGLCILKWSQGLPGNKKLSLELDLNSSHLESLLSSSNEREVGNLELLRLLVSCMETDALQRWTAQQLVHHPFFDQFKTELQFPYKKLMHFPPSKQEFQTSPSNKEFQLPPFKKEFQVSPLKTEKDLVHKREELLNPITKKSKISLKDEDWVESSNKPAAGELHAVPKRCIEHCKLFLPDCEFDKDKLVRMWIAEECIELGVTKRMEDVGCLYFDALVQEEIIVPTKFDNVHRQMKYKFNTSQVSDELLKQRNYLRINAGNMDTIYKEALHLTWQCKRVDRTFSDALKNFNQLHTLVVHEDCSASTSQLSNDIFLGLRLLRTLDLSRTHISEVPGSIGKLESLQYLDISETPIKRLPESLDRLYHLQTLNLKACPGISTLPRAFGRLVNLHHLDLDIVSQLKSMPRGMGNLIKLQTLRAFIVGKNDGCGIGELKNMNEITGSFCISRLENVSSSKEAKEAALWDKSYIDKLELRWNNCGNHNFQDTAEILESLQPHSNLKELQLTFYGGSKLPRWISNPAYSDLASITLYKCINCDILPSIGVLPSLKILHIVNMENLRNIDTVFCRNNESQVLNAFPMLERLTLDSMPALEEWTGVEDGDFPCLRHISIKYCPKLSALPSLSHLCSLEHFEISNCMQMISLPEGSLPGSLESLIIRGCPGLNESCRKDGGLDWFKIASVGNIWIDLEKISLDGL